MPQNFRPQRFIQWNPSYCDGSRLLYSDAAGGTFHQIESHTRVLLGRFLASVLHDSGTLPVIASTELNFENVWASLFPTKGLSQRCSVRRILLLTIYFSLS